MTRLVHLGDIMKLRKSVRQYDPNKKISNEQIKQIIELATSAPSSWNLQHWKFIVISTTERKQKLFPISYNQEQVITCSHLIVVLGDTEAYKNGEEIFAEQVKRGWMNKRAKDIQTDAILYAYSHNSEKYGVHDAIRNSSLAAMQIMLAAKVYNIDSCPMLSFKEKELKQYLEIPDRYIPVLMISLGYGTKNPYETLRFPVEKVMMEECFKEV
ncbi:nitroreductase family protein [Pseudoneobacillus sp. C159]